MIGPNGSGKSTLIKSIFGLCSIYSGNIKFHEKEIAGLVPHRIARERIAYMPQVNNVFANLTIRENLIMAGYTVDPGTVSERMPGILEAFPVLKRYENSKADTLSGGERQMLGMGMALIRKPTVMMFDEPTAGLSPKLAHEVLDKIKQLRDEFGITIVLVEQKRQARTKVRGLGVPAGRRQERLQWNAGRTAITAGAWQAVPWRGLTL